jgi:hypothetical protein
LNEATVILVVPINAEWWFLVALSKQLSSEILIDSSAKRVWELITDFEDFPGWNPFIRRATGEIKMGARLEVFIQPSGARGMTFHPKVLKVDPNHELRWLGRLYLPWLFDGEHAFIIEPSKEDSVRFIQSEKFTGLLVPFTRGLLRDTQRGFEEMNMALKQRAEQR